MVQPARIFTLWQRLYSRFLIEPVPSDLSETPGIATTIVPVTDADELLRVPTLKATTLTSVVGNQVFFTVPDRERWHLFAFHFSRSAGDRTAAQAKLGDTSEGLTMVVFEQVSAASGLMIKEGKPYILDQTDTIRVQIGGGTTDGNWDGRVWVEVEAAF